MKPFKTIYFDIVSSCNARCPYCLTGCEELKSGRMITPEKFEAVLLKLRHAGVLEKKSVISLYNWGEPFLHPKLDELVGIINKFDIRYALSTNASIPHAITTDFVKNLDHIIFSMCGFSQHSYSRIQGTDFGKVQKNIVKIVADCRAAGFSGSFNISFHTYKFNLDEMYLCQQFADDHGILFNPCYAILNHWWDLEKYVKGELDVSSVQKISEELIGLDEVAALMKKSPQPYSCPQHDLLIISENADVMACCQLPKDRPEFICGNILEDSIDSIINRKRNLPVCNECIKLGLAYYINHSLVTPHEHKKSLNQLGLSVKRKIRKLLP